MSEVTSTPPPPGTQPRSGKGQGPERASGPRTATDDAGSGERKPTGEQASRETEKAKARFDPAVAVAPSLAHLQPGQEIRGDIVRIDGEGRPVLETPDAAYALEPDAGLKKNDRVAIVIETVEKRAVGQLIERAGVRLETSVRVYLTLVSLHQTPDAHPEDAAARQDGGPVGYGAPTGQASGTAAEFDFETSALSLSDSGIPAHGAAPGSPAPAPDAPVEPYVLPKGKKAPATLTSTLIKAGERAGLPITSAPGAARIYAHTPGGEPGTEAAGAPPGQPALAEPSPLGANLDGGPGQAALPGILQPGTKLTARLVAASYGAPARQGLGNLQPGDSVTLTILAEGAENAGLAHSRALTGLITSAEEIAASATDAAALGSSSKAQEPGQTKAETKPESGPPVGGERRAAPRTGPRSDQHYIRTPAGAFLFHAAEKIAIGTRVTLAVTPGAPQSSHSTQAASPIAATPQPLDAAAAPADTPSVEARSQAQPATQAPPQALPPLVNYQGVWPLVDELIEAVAAAGPAAMKAMAPRLSSPGARLSSGLLFFLSALRLQNPRAWIGEQVARALEAKGKGKLLGKLKEEFARLGRVSADRPGADWRPFLIPLHTEGGAQAIALLTRPHHEDGDGATGRDAGGDDEDLTENQRFLLEVKLSALGPLQLDGLMRPERLDMVVRAGEALTGAMRDELRNLFENATSAAGLNGGLSFEPLSRSPVDVSRVLAEALARGHDPRPLV